MMTMKTHYKRRDALKLMSGPLALVGLPWLAGCGGGGDDAEELESIASSLLATTAENQAATFRHTDRLGPSRVIRRGASVQPLPAHARSLAGLGYEHAGQRRTLDDYMQRNRCSGLLILKNGELALERYGMGNHAGTRWTSFSAAKSLTSTLMGAALMDGSIASLDDPLTRYLPELAGSAYQANTLRELLRMCSGVAWNEDYSQGADSDIARLAQAWASGERGAVMKLMGSRPRAAAPGSQFCYSTGESYLLGAVVARATGSTLSDYLSRKIWVPMGMEADGYWMLDGVDGLEMGGNNFSATLRDYARFGQFFMQQGRIQGRAVLPSGWRDLAGHPDSAVTACGQLYPGYPLGYGYQWWSFPDAAQALEPHNGAFTAEGIFGQFIYINPAEQVVAVVWSAWPQPWVDSAELETYALIGSTVAALR
ncbi:serine hydrolase domain-containing protein [Paucibacter soli]|uniref:serine hydrolase domain-containing protein n=1 Tax=Paucibacter soli TaxID=3133433 RepID=UPI00309F5690